MGRVLNVFSRDVNTLDETLPRSISMSMSTIFSTLSVVFVISFIIPPFLTILLPLVYIYKYIEQYYMNSSRELKRLESITKSPIYAQFSETLVGVSTIKPYDRVDSFIRLNNRKIDTNNEVYFASQVANRWLSLRLDMIGVGIVGTSTIFAVTQREYIDPGTMGLMLSYALSITGTLSWLVRQVTETETYMVSVERLDQYRGISAEAPAELEARDRGVDDNWPSQGGIELDNVQLRYREGLELVLKGVSAKIRPQEKLGIVGRTGSGKSSLMLALFRMIELSGGKIVIDGVDISKLGLNDLRRALSIIPQDPTLFTGTVRSNLDPFNEYQDDDLWKALESVHMKEAISQLPSKLEAPITEGGENMSVGERQLMCLGRAILKKSKILVMDEATAAVDFETDSLIQTTIRREFKNVTVLTIAHRIHTVLDSDRILVFDAGKILELDTPQNLMDDHNSVFRSMLESSGIKQTDTSAPK